MQSHIVLVTNLFRDAGFEKARQIYHLLTGAGHDVVVSPVFLADWNPEMLSGMKSEELKDAVVDASLVVVMGGDGTMLYVADVVRGREIPIIGINLGGKGFLAGLEESETELLLDVADGKHTLSRRMMLDVQLIRDGRCIFSQCVLNDVVIHGVQAECIGILAKCNGSPVTHFTGDGIIVATPTGSTAYSMSAGGPLVEPDNENIILTPICPHSMAGKSFVLLPNRVVTIEPERIHDRPAVLLADGGEGVPLVKGDCIRICKSQNSVLLAETGARSFYENAFEKLTGLF
jgi:NAD+ kinase